MSGFAVGLVVGKFAPLHRGHQYLLDVAAARCERLLVLSYAKPERPGCEPARRERWLQTLYPQATRLVLDDARLALWCARHGRAAMTLPHDDAGDEAHRAFVGWVLREMFGARVDAVFTSEAYGDGFAASLGRQQGGAPVVHVEVDRARRRHPVSGTQVRADPHAWRDQLDPRVHADFVERIVLLGGESSGKTSLAQALATRLDTHWVPEYGRELWEQRGGTLVFDDLLEIAREQVAREAATAAQACRYLVCDTSPLTTLQYALAMFGRTTPLLDALAQRHYDHVFLCAPDFPFVQDGTRQTGEVRAAQHSWYLQQLEARGIAYRLLQGSLECRLAQVLRALAA